MKLPRIIQNIYRKYETGINIHINSLNQLLLMSFINGEQLKFASDISGILLKNVGITLAKYNLAMQSRRGIYWGYCAEIPEDYGVSKMHCRSLATRTGHYPDFHHFPHGVAHGKRGKWYHPSVGRNRNTEFD